LSLSEQHGFGLWRNLARIVSALSANRLDSGAVKLEEVRAELDDHVRRGQRMGITVLYALLCRALIEQGRANEASDAADEARKIGCATEELLFEAEFCRVKAQALLINAPDASSSAQTMLEQALEIARDQEARSIELLVVRDLAALLRKEGSPGKARDLLAPTYAWFTEGFATPDLKEAKVLLEHLGGG
jgi:predicted ATPase